jgi:glycolate oxidase FAD binding subunit
MLQVWAVSCAAQSQFASVLDSDRIRQPRGFEAAVAPIVLEPASVDELAQVVRKCERDRLSLAPAGACRTLRHLRAAPVDAAISLVRLAQVISYEPDDMTVVAGAGITLSALDSVLGRHGQYLPVDPASPDQTTVGAMLAAAHSGPLRLSAGTARDLLIGVQFVGHGAAAVRGGGRVVKNVAGYDLMKVMIGSFGTLGIITEAIFKVRPVPQTYAVALSYHHALRGAFDAAFQLHDALPLLHLEIASPGVNLPMSREGQFMLAAGVSGNRKDVDYQMEFIHQVVPESLELTGGDAHKFYRALRDLELPDAAIRMQLAVLPRELPLCLEQGGAQFRAHAACGVAQIAFDGDAAAIGQMRHAAAQARGHARVLSLDPALRGAVPLFEPPAAGVMKLMRRLKAAFDPAGIFNPGCFIGGL